MITDIGEYIVGAYLKLILNCDVVDYNVRPPGGGLEGLEEIDVIGLNFKSDTAYLCEVTTHICGVLYKNRNITISRIKKKYERLKKYAYKYLQDFKNKRYMFWAPVVHVGNITKGLNEIKGLQKIINGEYKKRIQALQEMARRTTHDARNPFFRMLQIIEHLRD